RHSPMWGSICLAHIVCRVRRKSLGSICCLPENANGVLKASLTRVTSIPATKQARDIAPPTSYSFASSTRVALPLLRAKNKPGTFAVLAALDRLTRPLLRLVDPEDAHSLALAALRLVPRSRPPVDDACLADRKSVV